MGYDRYCRYCYKPPEPLERCTCGKKSEAAAAGTVTTSKNEPSTHMVHREAADVKREGA